METNFSDESDETEPEDTTVGSDLFQPGGGTKARAKANQRHKWLLEHGYTPEVAAEMAQTPIKATIKIRAEIEAKFGEHPPESFYQQFKALKSIKGAKKRFTSMLAEGIHWSVAVRLARQRPASAGPSYTQRRKEHQKMKNKLKQIAKREMMRNGKVLEQTTMTERFNARESSGEHLTDGEKGILKHHPNYMSMDIATIIPVRISFKGFPKVTMSGKTSRKLAAAIQKEVDGQDNSNLKLSLGEAVLIQGYPTYLLIPCLNQRTAQWLLQMIPSFEPWKRVSLVTVSNNDLAPLLGTNKVEKSPAELASSSGGGPNYE